MDIHLEPFEDGCKFRLRIDGVLHELPSLLKTAFIMIISRLKILAKMDIAEKRIPQDGAIPLRTGDKRVDLRVNTVPYGARRKDGHANPRQRCDPAEPDRAGARRAAVEPTSMESIHSPYGLALVTGPTGSGKLIMLYF